MKLSILFIATAVLLASCTSVLPVSGTIVADHGEIRVHPDGRIEVEIDPSSDK